MKIRRNVNVTKVVLTNFILSPVEQHKNKKKKLPILWHKIRTTTTTLTWSIL